MHGHAPQFSASSAEIVDHSILKAAIDVTTSSSIGCYRPPMAWMIGGLFIGEGWNGLDECFYGSAKKVGKSLVRNGFQMRIRERLRSSNWCRVGEGLLDGFESQIGRLTFQFSPQYA